MHVDQPRQQRLAGKVDMLDVGGPAHCARVADPGDAAIVADEDRGMLDVAPAGHVEIAIGGDDGGRRGGHGERQRRGGNQQGSNHSWLLSAWQASVS